MNLSTPFRLTACLTATLLFVSACTLTEPPPPATATRAPSAVDTRPANVEAPPASTQELVAFPTAAPATSTTAAPTLTAAASPSEVRLTVAPPVVQVVAPLPGAQVSISQTIFVVAYAASESAIARIELTDDGIPVRAETPALSLPTFSAILPWTPTQIGAHILRVTAFDTNSRASAAEEISVSVTPDTRRPTASILYPLGSPQVELGSVLQVYAAGTDEVGVKRLDLWVDNQLYTYILPQNSPSVPSLPTVFAWNAASAGNHTLVVRATDTQDQTTDSPPLKIIVVDTHAPALSVSFDHSSLLVAEPMTITLTALDVSGIQRVELWTGKEISNTVTSANPARQTSLSTQFVWSNGAAGDYQIIARAYNASGNYKESPPQTISVLRPGQPTPTRTAMPTATRARTPRPQPTPRLQPPAPPTVEISQPGDHFTSQGPLRITVNARASSELDRMEVWGYYQGQPNPQVVCTIDARATTSKTGQCDWSPNDAGVVSLYAQAIDNFQQYGRSSTISGLITIPSLPTPTPTPASLAGRWSATVPAGQYVVVFRPIATASGVALRGDFKIVSAATPFVETAGRVPSGAIKADRVTFRAEFAAPVASGTPTSDTPPPTAASTLPPTAPALDFDCGVDSTATTLDCKFKDARGQTGAAMFRREGS